MSALFKLAAQVAQARLKHPAFSRTIALETGIQDGPMAVLIVTLSIASAIQQDALLIPVLYSLLIVLSSSVVTVFFATGPPAKPWRATA